MVPAMFAAVAGRDVRERHHQQVEEELLVGVVLGQERERRPRKGVKDPVLPDEPGDGEVVVGVAVLRDPQERELDPRRDGDEGGEREGIPPAPAELRADLRGGGLCVLEHRRFHVFRLRAHCAAPTAARSSAAAPGSSAAS